MTIGALEVSATRFGIRWDIPTAASFIGYKGKTVVVGDFLREGGIRFNGAESVGKRERRAS